MREDVFDLLEPPVVLLRNIQRERKERTMTTQQEVPTGTRVPHPAEAAASTKDLTRAEMRWQRVLEVIAWREPWIEMYLRGSRIEYADAREVHYSVIGDNAVAVLNRSPALDVVHEAVREVTRKRLHPVAHLSKRAMTDEEREMYRRSLDDAERAIRRVFPAAEVVE